MLLSSALILQFNQRRHCYQKEKFYCDDGLVGGQEESDGAMRKRQ